MNSLPRHKYNLILDIDETLVSAIPVSSHDKELAKRLICETGLLTVYEDYPWRYFVFMRPHIMEFLSDVAYKFNIYVYTNGCTTYANVIMSMLACKLGHNFVQHSWTRTHGEPAPKYIANTGLNPERTIVLDDLVKMWPNDPTNVIQIKQFNGPRDLDYQDDTELHKMLTILNKVRDSNVDDVRNIVWNENSKYRMDFNVMYSIPTITRSETMTNFEDVVEIESDTESIIISGSIVDTCCDVCTNN